MASKEHLSDREWLAREFEALTDEVVMMTPSAWAEQKRYLPPSVTALPGFYRFEVTPYLREIVDCLSIDSPVREVSVMKGVQICATTGIIENFIGYCIDHVKTAPCMFVTADAELAKLRMDSYITPMLIESGLQSLIRSSDESNKRKTGHTDKKLEWEGGGFLLPAGAQNPNKMRMASMQMMLRDEVDGWPDVVGKDGDPMKLTMDRTAAYETSRKVVDLSTPLIKGQSKIEKRFEAGDKRYYYVPCLNPQCGHMQTLRWRTTDKDTGEVTGIVWQTQNGRLVADSVRYRCVKCSHEHTNDDKTRMLANGEWRPTKEPNTAHHRSYHISALYSPVGMQSWEACVQKWIEAWDDETGKPKDIPKLQVFYNNVLGESFSIRGEKLRFEAVSGHRRHWYRFGEIPNQFAQRYSGSPILLLTCAVDVHAHSLKVAVLGWCRDRRPYVIEYASLEGDTENLDDKGTWGELRKLIENKEYVADDGKRYRIQIALIDSGYRTDQVYRFCLDYPAGVFPIKGVDAPPKRARLLEFNDYVTPMGTAAFSVTVDLYKDRWSGALKRGWDEQQDIQPEGHFNAPSDITDKQLKELTAETKVEKIDPRTGQRTGFEWRRPSGAANELWDLLVYSNAALDIVAWNVCVGQMEMKAVDWRAFYDLLEREHPFFTPG
jgi:phage terminase large subunit GpA-like protein